MQTLSSRESQLIQQAQIWKGEAVCANHTIGQIYQLCTRSRGEPGNWHGAEPVKALVAERDALRAALFAIQCEQLDLATDTVRSARALRQRAMATRNRIIGILSGADPQ